MSGQQVKMGTVSGTRDVVSQSLKVKDGWVWSECLLPPHWGSACLLCEKPWQERPCVPVNSLNLSIL